MVILLLKGYNNYFNRIVKSEIDINGYKQASSSYLEYDHVNFDPKDGIATTLVVGGANQLDASDGVLCFDDLGCPDYLVCYSDTDKYDIKSKWFVVECEKVMQGQYRLALKRDVLADFNSQVMQSPCFVEKGSITDVYSPLLHNSEGMAFNQIKQSEDFVKDDTKCAWLVGYVNKKIEQADLQSVNPITYTAPDATPDLPDTDEFYWEPCIQYFDLDGDPVNQVFKKCMWLQGTNTSWRTYYQLMGTNRNVRTTLSADYNVILNESDKPNADWKGLTYSAFDLQPGVQVLDSHAQELTARMCELTRINQTIQNYFTTMTAWAKYQALDGYGLVEEDVSAFNGRKVIHDNKVYKLTIAPGRIVTVGHTLTSGETQAVNWLRSVSTAMGTDAVDTVAAPNAPKLLVEFTGQEYQIIAQEIPADETISYNFPASGARNACEDASYDMFAMPVDPNTLGMTVSSDDVVIAYEDGEGDLQAASLSAISVNQLAIANEICMKLGGGGSASKVYDLQLLPYCPFENINAYFENAHYGPTYNKYVIDVRNLSPEDFTLLYNSAAEPAVRGVVFYPKHANFSFKAPYSLPNESEHYEWQTIENPKFVYNNTSWQGRPQYIFLDWPYECTDGVQLPQESLKFDFDSVRPDYIEAHVSTGAKKPMIVLTSDDLPANPTPSQEVTVLGYVMVKAHWITPDTPAEIKLQSECDMYRLASPNYNSVYEFKKTKLKGGIKSFNVDCTYKPFTPYIKVNPNYDGSLYSVDDFNDSMGLICNGDFSLPMLTDAWVNYELQNRNYQAIFNRQIQNLDVNNQIAKEKQQFTDTMGVITAGVGGAAGAGLAAAWGHYAGAATSVGSGIAGIAMAEAKKAKDQDWLERQQTEARSFATDNYRYQLGNVQALSPTITKSTPLTYNNKVWPILEKFSCTETEKDLLREKIKYDGMTVMAVGRLADYAVAGGYLKGKLIRIVGLEDDSHIAQAIYEAVDRGFYQGE